MGNWNDLSMAQRAEVMKIAVQNGMYNLDEIKSVYNEFAEGGKKESANWTMEDEAKYREWRDSLPDNLRNTDDRLYDMRGAYRAGLEPTLEDDGFYHLGSRDPKTGRILKSVLHPTFLQAIDTDIKMGYYPVTDKQGNIYTKTWEGNRFAYGGDMGNYYDGWGDLKNFLKKAYHGAKQLVGLEDTPLEASQKRGAARYSEHGYIGGENRETRQKYFDVDKELTDSVNSISKRYGLNPSVVASRMAEEGPIDAAVRAYNDENNEGTKGMILSDNNQGTYGPLWGLDDFYSRANDEKVKVTTSAPHSYKKQMFVNEHGRLTESVTSPQWWFGIEATAAEMKARRDKLKKNNPWMDSNTLDAAAAMSFNYGETGVQKHINSKKRIPKRFNPYIKTK